MKKQNLQGIKESRMLVIGKDLQKKAQLTFLMYLKIYSVKRRVQTLKHIVTSWTPHHCTIEALLTQTFIFQ